MGGLISPAGDEAGLKQNHTLQRGFLESVFDSQSVFRTVLNALSEPGTPINLAVDVPPPAGLYPATAAFLLALADFETPIWLPPDLAAGEAGAWVRFHCGSMLVEEPQEAVFAVMDGAAPGPSLDQFCLGIDQFPDRSTTVIVQCMRFGSGEAMTLSGPGIKERRSLVADGLRATFNEELRANARFYPMGVDTVLVAGSAIVGLPRTTLVGEQG